MKRLCKAFILILLALAVNFNCHSQESDIESEFQRFIQEFSRKDFKQTDNIRFPFLVISDNDSSYIQKDEWKNIDYCFGCEFSPLLFLDTPINQKKKFFRLIDENTCRIQAYIMPDNKIQTFYFTKTKDTWLLDKIESSTIEPSSSESFFEFISKFASDPGFIKERISTEAKYISSDFGSCELKESEIKLQLLERHDYLFKRIYVLNPKTNADQSIIYIKGEGTGYHLEYHFTKSGGKWYLLKLVNAGA